MGTPYSKFGSAPIPKFIRVDVLKSMCEQVPDMASHEEIPVGSSKHPPVLEGLHQTRQLFNIADNQDESGTPNEECHMMLEDGECCRIAS